MASLQFASAKEGSPELAAKRAALLHKIAVVERLLETKQYQNLWLAADELCLELAESLGLIEKILGVPAGVSDFPVISGKKAA